MRLRFAAGKAFLLLAGACFTLWAGPEDSPTARIDRIFSSAIPPSEAGCAVIVKRNGKVIFQKGYGVRELRTHAKITPDTNFRLASVTKQFTAMAIELLIHDGKLNYEDRLTVLFPDFPAYGNRITIRNLLTHTSGLPDYGELMAPQEGSSTPRWTPEHQISDEEVLTLLKSETAGRFPPGTQWEYSNSGYVVLGLIVAKVSGMPYREFLQKRIFVPLKMNHTLVYQKGINNVRQRAYGHNRMNEKIVEMDQSPTSATLGDGGIYSNVVDMGKWDEGLRLHTLLSAKEMEPAFTPVRLNDGSLPHWPRNPRSTDTAEPPVVSYGFGWMLDPYQGHTRAAHDGGTMGFRTTIQRFTDDQFTIVVLSNRTDINPEELALKVADVELEGMRVPHPHRVD